MIEMYSAFEEKLRRLNRLTRRRKLFGEELYQAALLMGQLTMHCYEEGTVAGMGGKSAAGRSATSKRSGKTSRTKTDHTAGVYLQLVGRVKVTPGSKKAIFAQRDGTLAERSLRKGERLQVCGKMYVVANWAELDDEITFAEPFALEDGEPVPPELREGASGETWAMLEEKSPGTNQDMQMLLMNLKAHTPALTLLANLPFEKSEIKADELEIRAVLRAAYRLLKAMCTDFPLMQTELVASIPLFVDHTEANLVSYDITPTGCINACFKDNRTVCAQVTEDTVRQFVRLAAQEKAPRFLRFLRMITMPNDQVIRRARQIYESLPPSASYRHLFIPYR